MPDCLQQTTWKSYRRMGLSRPIPRCSPNLYHWFVSKPRIGHFGHRQFLRDQHTKQTVPLLSFPLLFLSNFSAFFALAILIKWSYLHYDVEQNCRKDVALSHQVYNTKKQHFKYDQHWFVSIEQHLIKWMPVIYKESRKFLYWFHGNNWVCASIHSSSFKILTKHLPTIQQ